MPNLPGQDWFSDKEVHWRPQQYWAPGTKVVTDIAIYGIDLGNGIYGQEDRHISFGRARRSRRLRRRTIGAVYTPRL